MEADAGGSGDVETENDEGTDKRHRKRESSGNGKKSPKKPAKTPSDPSTWPMSKVPACVWISKGIAQEQYRLRKEDFNGLVPDIRKNGMFIRGGIELSTHWYREREIERCAWERHGGPEGFKAYLEKLKARQIKMTVGKGKPSKFSQPFPHYTTDVLDPLVRGQTPRIQQEMIEMLFPPWLWRELQRHTDATTSSVNVKLDMLRAAVRQKLWEQYSERPETGALSSMAFGNLESLLSRAPSYADKIQSLDMEFFDSGGVERYEWSPKFKDGVNSAVDAVRVQHGEPGKILALWLLYHAYARCIRCRGMRFIRGTAEWEDEAARVFRGPL